MFYICNELIRPKPYYNTLSKYEAPRRESESFY